MVYCLLFHFFIERASLESNDLVWYFFCPRDRKYSSGLRTNRSTGVGYWKATGKDRPVVYNSRTVGMKRTLVFHLGKPPRGDRTDWVMYEYRLEDKELAASGVKLVWPLYVFDVLSLLTLLNAPFCRLPSFFRPITLIWLYVVLL